VTAAPASVPLFTPTSATDPGTATTSGPTAAPTTRAATTTFQVTSTAAPTTAATTTAAPTTAATTTAAPTIAAPTSAAPTTAAATTTAPAAWTVVWYDEFTSGLGPDWSAVGTGAGVFDDTFGSECYAPSQVTVAGGVLQLTAQQKPVTCNGVARSWVSGLVTTRRHFSQTYGRFEARMKLPVAKGTWPAFWLMPENPTYGQWPGSGEIDVMEYVAKPLQTVFQTIHWAEAGAHKASSAAANLTTPASDWHRYAIEWEPRTVRWYVDDLLVHAYTIPSGTAPFDQPFYLILNQAVGGDWAGAPDPASYPATVSVDWVRVSKRA
jgi:beta-glucanase (GH16 family)